MKLIDKPQVRAHLLDFSSCSTPVALSTLVPLDAMSDPEDCTRGQVKHSARSSRCRKSRPLVRIGHFREEKRKYNSNEPLKASALSCNRTDSAEKAGSRNSSTTMLAVTSKRTLRFKRAARQLRKTKQSGSCRQKKEEKRRRYGSRRGNEQENLYNKGAKREHMVIKRKIKSSAKVVKHHNCSIYQNTGKRSGNKTLSTHAKYKYTYKREPKYLNSIEREKKIKGLTSKTDLTSKADDPLTKVYNGTTLIIFCKPLRAALRAHLIPRLSIVANLNQLRQLLIANKAKDKGKNGNINRKNTEPTGKAVRPSTRGNQNFEAARWFKSRIRKYAINMKRARYITRYTCSSIKYKILDNSPAAHYPRKRQNLNKTKLKINKSKTVQPSSRGNQNYEAARCYKSRKNAVRPSSRSNQNFEAARCYKARKDRHESDKIPKNLTRASTNLTAVKVNLTAVKTNLTAVKTNLTAVKANLTRTCLLYTSDAADE